MSIAVGPVLAAQRRMLAPDRSAYETFDRIYTPALVVVIVGAMFWKIVHEAIIALTPQVSATWLPGAGLLVVLALARFGLWQGPVSFTQADCSWLLGGPLSRATLVRRRLRSSAVIALVGGLLLGGAVAAGVGSAGHTTGLVIGATIAGGGLLLLLGAGVSWHVQRSAPISTWVARLTPVAVLAAAALVVGAHHGLRDDLIWAGPWGWALVPEATADAGPIALALVLLAVLTIVVWVLAWRTAAGCTRERYEARASTRASLSAAAFTADYRGVMTSRRRQGTPGWAARIGLGGTAQTVVAWRDLRYFAGAPLRAFAAVALMAAGTVMALANRDRVGLILLGMVLAAAAGTGLLEPLRIEVDHPDRARILLPWTYGSALWRHCVAPIVMLSLTVVVAALGTAIAGTTTWAAAGGAVAIGIPASAIVVLCGAMSSRRGGRLPTEMVLNSAGDPSGFSGIGMIGLWLGAWPIGGTLVAAWPALAAHSSHGPVGTIATGATVNAALALALQRYLLLSKTD